MKTNLDEDCKSAIKMHANDCKQATFAHMSGIELDLQVENKLSAVGKILQPQKASMALLVLLTLQQGLKAESLSSCVALHVERCKCACSTEADMPGRC